MFNISIILCTYNSSDFIQPVLAGIAQQKTSNELELIVVDNNSTDQTAERVYEIWNNLGNPFVMTIISEPKQGQLHARKAGVLKARYPILCFCDDDNILPMNYLNEGLLIFANHENVGVLGGLGIPIFETKKPEWFDKFSLYYAVGEQFDRDGDITNKKGWVYGAASIYKTEILQRIMKKGGFICFGRTGQNQSSGDDIELCYRMILEGAKIFYASNLKFFHRISGKKLNLDYLIRLKIAGSLNSFLLDGLAYQAGARQGWYNKRYKRSWIFRAARTITNLKIFLKEKEIPLKFKIQIYVLRIIAILRLNRNYDKSFFK